jgi:hypothetical protein
MKSVLSSRAVLSAVLASFASVAAAAPVNGSSTGLSAPAVTVTFDEHVFEPDTLVTTQYADVGVTFVADGGSTAMFYDPADSDGPYGSVGGHYIGNYHSDGDPEVSSLAIIFSTAQTRAAFGVVSNFSDFSFQAFLGNTLVDSFIANVSDGYFGFSGSQSFDRIVLTTPAFSVNNAFAADAVAPTSDFYLLDNIQFGGSPDVTTAAVPEPGVLALLGLGAAASLAMRRRRSGSARPV